jgi:hypothetical protein
MVKECSSSSEREGSLERVKEDVVVVLGTLSVEVVASIPIIEDVDEREDEREGEREGERE